MIEPTTLMNVSLLSAFFAFVVASTIGYRSGADLRDYLLGGICVGMVITIVLGVFYWGS